MKSKKILKLFIVCCLTFIIFTFSSCKKEKKKLEMYENNGYYLPVETKGYTIESAVLIGKMESSKQVFAQNETELHDLLNLFCSKNPLNLQPFPKDEFFKYYLAHEGFFVILTFSSETSSDSLIYDFYMTNEGVMFYCDYDGPLCYKNDEINFGDYDAVSQYFNNWELD